MTASPWLRLVLIGLPFLWLALFFLLPLLIVAEISLAESADGIPPYTPLFADRRERPREQRDLANFRQLAEGCSARLSRLARQRRAGDAALPSDRLSDRLCDRPRAGELAALLLFLVMLPFWTSFLIRVYAWIALLEPNGLMNRSLIALGLIAAPLPLLNNHFSVELGLVYSYLPFMILPLYGSLSRLDQSLVEAAADLGARPGAAVLGVILPLTLPGIAAGSLLVLIPAIGEFVIPDLLGGPDTLMIGKVLWDEFFNNRRLAGRRRRRGRAGRGIGGPATRGTAVSRAGGVRRDRASRTVGVPGRRRCFGLWLSVCADRAAGRSTRSMRRGWSRSGPGSRPAGMARCSMTRSFAPRR